jgi:hypothetical protein
MPTFQDHIATERERLQKLRADAVERRQTIDAEIADIDREMRAIAAYETAKHGRSSSGTTATGRAPRGAQQETLLAMIGGRKGGMKRADILEEVGVKGDKKREASVSNALTNMKKAGKLNLDGGVYTVAA